MFTYDIYPLISRDDLTFDEFISSLKNSFLMSRPSNFLDWHKFKQYIAKLRQPEQAECLTEVTVSNESLQQAKKMLTDAKNWTREQAYQAAQVYYNNSVSVYHQMAQSVLAIKDRCRLLRDRLMSWSDPSFDDSDFKEQIVNELTEALKIHLQLPQAPIRLAALEYKNYVIETQQNLIRKLKLMLATQDWPATDSSDPNSYLIQLG
jgi:hypothetical protein